MARTPIGIDTSIGRICCHCKKEKPFEDFTKDNGTGGVNGLHRECKECVSKRQKRYYQINKGKICARTRKNHRKHRLDPGYKEKERGQYLKSTYGITLEDYDRMFNKQNGDCAICGLPQLMKRLSVDHSHKTGKVRALLCDRCNRALGTVGDDIDLLQKLIKYLRRF